MHSIGPLGLLPSAQWPDPATSAANATHARNAAAVVPLMRCMTRADRRWADAESGSRGRTSSGGNGMIARLAMRRGLASAAKPFSMPFTPPIDQLTPPSGVAKQAPNKAAASALAVSGISPALPVPASKAALAALATRPEPGSEPRFGLLANDGRSRRPLPAPPRPPRTKASRPGCHHNVDHSPPAPVPTPTAAHLAVPAPVPAPAPAHAEAVSIGLTAVAEITCTEADGGAGLSSLSENADQSGVEPTASMLPGRRRSLGAGGASGNRASRCNARRASASNHLQDVISGLIHMRRNSFLEDFLDEVCMFMHLFHSHAHDSGHGCAHSPAHERGHVNTYAHRWTTVCLTTTTWKHSRVSSSSWTTPPSLPCSSRMWRLYVPRSELETAAPCSGCVPLFAPEVVMQPRLRASLAVVSPHSGAASAQQAAMVTRWHAPSITCAKLPQMTRWQGRSTESKTFT